MAHTEAAADSDVVPDKFAVLDDRDVSEILRKDIDVIGRWDGEAGFELTGQVGVAVHRFDLRLAAGHKFLVEVDLVVGAGLGEGVVTPVCRVLVDLLQNLGALGIRRGHHVAVHVAAGRDRIEQDLVHSLDEFLDIALQDPVKLEGLARCKSQGRGGDLVGQIVEHDPLLGRGLAAGKANAAHEGKSLFFPFFLQGVP